MTQDFREFVQSLNEHNVKYLIIGGYAVAFHGHPRYTKDLDVWVQRNKNNAENLLKALDEFGFGSLNFTIEDFLDHDQVVQLGYPPNRIDILSDLVGVNFEECYSSRVEVTIENVKINFIDLENLKKNKKASGRHQDLADFENLE